MSESKHTPGPWTVGGNGSWICTVGNNHDDPAIFGPRPPDGEAFPFGDKLADARLIAAAPELLATIIECRKQIESIIEDGTPTDWSMWRDDLDALIAKAGAA